jgi:hypothetical protein
VAVGEHGALRVQERIEVDFTSPKHGIYRDIPVHYNVRQGFAHDLHLEVESVVDVDGHVVATTVRRAGRNVRIRIGDPERTVQGVQTYVLRYRVRNGVDFHPEHDELYWNVTGDAWPVPIENASVRVHWVRPMPPASVEANVYTGAYGARGEDAVVEPVEGGYAAHTTRPLEAWEGLTVALGWPKGIVEPPSQFARVSEFLRWNWLLFLPLPVGIWVLRRWRATGRDPSTGRSVAVQYAPPPALTAAEVGTLVDERADLRDITAAVIDLAVRGHLRIEVQSSKLLGLFEHQEYVLVRLSPPADAAPLKPFETALLAGLFERGERVRLEDLRARFYTHLPTVRRGIYSALVQAKLFDASPDAVRGRWVGSGVAVLVVGGLFTVWWVRRLGLDDPIAVLPPLAGVVLCAVIFFVAARAMPRRTRRGVELTQWSRGLEEFIRRVEAPRLGVEERAGLDPRAQFERVLPYAMALGLGSRWASAFASVYTTPPAWYAGPADPHFSSLRFVAGLEHMRGSMATDMSSAPRSSGGGSGMGGGGFSGGGHGGGGGGAW